MPLRYIAALPTPALCPAPLIFGARSNPSRFRRPQCPFHTTRCLRDEEIDRATNHYEALKLPTNASPADIKRSFYALSKTNHPDHNRSDPAASKRFMRISEAYTTLSSPEKRTRYDRDVLNLHHPHESHPGRRGGLLQQHHQQPGGRAAGLGLEQAPEHLPRPAPQLLPQRGLGRPRREAVRGPRQYYRGRRNKAATTRG
ncbi:DnaJ domain-containing protein [Apiospora arundinis]